MNMKKVNLDTWIQLIGMLSIVASLLFVGLEMRQSHRFALAAQQQARTEIFIDALNTMSETDVSFQDFQIKGVSNDNETQIENFMHQAWWVHENDFLQYRLGLMDQSIWDAKLQAISLLYNGSWNGLPDMCARAKNIWNVRKPILDQELVALVENIPSAC